MSAYLSPLLQLQRFILPGLIIFLIWAIWRTVFRRDRAVGLALYVSLVVVVGYLNIGIYLPGLEKGSIRYSELCALFLLINQPPATLPRPQRRTIYWLLWIYFALLFLAALRSHSIQAGIFEFRRIIVPQIVAFLVARRGLGSLSEYRRFFLCLMTLVILVGVFVFWDVFFDRTILKSDMLNHPAYYHNRQLNRFGSFFLNPNTLGAFIVLVFPSVFVWTLNERQILPRLFGWTALLALPFCLTQTQSRVAVMAFGITILFLVFGPAGTMSRKRRLGYLTLVALVLTLFMPGFYEHAVQRFESTDSETSINIEISKADEGRTRKVTWLYTKRMIADHPLFGIGFGESQFMKFMYAYGFEDEYGVEPLDAPHNSYLQAAVYAGIPALAAFLLANTLLLGIAALVFLRGVKGEITHVAFGLAVGLAGFLACIYTDLQLFTSSVAPVYWVFFGLLVSLLTRAPNAQPA